MKAMGERKASGKRGRWEGGESGVQRGCASVPDVSDHGAFSWSSSSRSTLD